MTDYQTKDFNYTLPAELIAKYPLKDRSASRLLCVDAAKQSITHGAFIDIEQLVQANDLLVLNNTKVIPARLFGQKITGGQIECMVERLLPSQQILAHIKASKSPKIGTQLILSGCLTVTVIARRDGLFVLQCPADTALLSFLDKHGQMPLPPYIDRAPEEADKQRYQTVFARESGAVAAPTASLHFDDALLAKLAAKGVQTAYVTLHVGAGTFQPVRVADLDDHVMHHEWMSVPQATCDAIKQCRERGGRVIAVGTTVVRSLETAGQGGTIAPYCGDTNLFIRPGYEFRYVDVLLTNFHLPESTLLMLVSAFAGYELTQKAYQAAIQENYRFFSYGDAMWLIQ